MVEGNDLFRRKWGVSHSLVRLEQRRGTQPLETSNQLSDVGCSQHRLELGQDQDMGRNVPMAALLAPRRKREKKPSAAGEQQAKKKGGFTSTCGLVRCLPSTR